MRLEVKKLRYPNRSRRERTRGGTDRVEAAIRGQIVSLAKKPGIAHWRKDLTDEGVKFYPVYSYLILYRPDTKPLHIVAILQGRRDVSRTLRDVELLDSVPPGDFVHSHPAVSS
jgi:plasmid stabilization system protein ParE